MLENFLMANGMYTLITGHYSGRDLSITVKPNECLILDSSDDDMDKLYEGDHAGAKQFLSQWWDL